MDNIIDLLKENSVNQPTQQQPAPTENAQVMCSFDVAISPVIYRFNSAKKGRKAYEDIVKAWKARQVWLSSVGDRKKPVTQFFDVKADMFDGCIDLDRIVSISFVEWPKRDKFVPRML